MEMFKIRFSPKTLKSSVHRHDCRCVQNSLNDVICEEPANSAEEAAKSFIESEDLIERGLKIKIAPCCKE